MNAKQFQIHCSGSKSPFKSQTITDSKSAADYARQFYSDDINIYESVFIILLNRTNKTIGWAKISQGGIDATVVDMKIVCKYAIDTLASGVVLVHNHPSGNTKIGASDKTTTTKIRKALECFDVNLLDHIILCENGYSSFTEEGLL